MDQASGQEIVMFYNVENFFSADPTPVHRTDPTPSGLRNWNGYRYKNKLFKTAHAVQLLAEKEGQFPAIIGLSEIQGKKVLEDLAAHEIFGSRYGTVHYDSMDERGVDTALLYDKSKVEILHSEPISYFFEKQNSREPYDTTRDVLWCKVRLRETIINVFVLHLPSKRENDINKPKRDYILHDLSEKIAHIRENSSEEIFVMGDFNENPDEDNLLELSGEGRFLQNPAAELFKNSQFSTFYGKNGLLFDQMLFSRGFSDGTAPLHFSGFNIFNDEKLSTWDRNFAGRPFRTYAGTRYLGGYSDHFPVYAVFTFKQKL